MGSSAKIPTWTTSVPAAWPDAPAVLTVSTLSAIEACPRRWALGEARYPELWSGRGYPPRLHPWALAGSVVHLALETIVGALASSGCSSLGDEEALVVLRDLGGYTTVLNDCIGRVLGRHADNPRAENLMDMASRTLRGQVPELRSRTQTMLSWVQLPRVRRPLVSNRGTKRRGPLPAGVYSECHLNARRLKWKGIADLLVLTSDTCQIIDFKTGAPDEGHRFQILVYALLWSQDLELNPHQRPASRLVLSYTSGEIEMAAPTEAELEDLEKQVVSRTTAALKAVSETPPEAKPSQENCPRCDVRHMCEEYWTGDTQRLMAQSTDQRWGTDVEIRITGPHGPTSWDAVIAHCPNAMPGQPFLLRADNRQLALSGGTRIRLLSVRLSEESEGDPQSVLIGTLGAAGEIFLIP